MGFNGQNGKREKAATAITQATTSKHCHSVLSSRGRKIKVSRAEGIFKN